MSQNTYEGNVDDQIGRAGVVDENETYDIDRVQASAPEPNGVKEVRVKVPSAMPEQQAVTMFNVGADVIKLISAGWAVLHFPTVTQHPQSGQPVPTIGTARMILADNKDVQRVLDLMKVINEQNTRISKAQERPVDLAGVTIEATKTKDEALRQLKQKVTGETPIILAR